MTKEELKQEAGEWIAKNSKEFITNPNYSPFDYAEAIYIASAEPRERRIEELEKACEETQELLDKQIEATYKLDKENAELKKDKKELCHSISEGGKACVYLNEQLTKAKELLKKLLSAYTTYADSFDDRDNEIVEEAEQFLKEEPQSKWVNPVRTTNDNEIKINSEVEK